MQKYAGKIEEEMKTFYESLNEKDKRRYAAVEASKLGRGGQVYITFDASSERKFSDAHLRRMGIRM